MLTSWIDYLMLLLQGSSVVIMTALILFSIPRLRTQLLFQKNNLKKQFIVIILFTVFAIYGTHAGKIISLNGDLRSTSWSYQLTDDEAVINFRDMIVVSAGLAAGPWVGTLVGAFSGMERYSLGGFTALSCAIASLLSGLLAGLISKKMKFQIKPYQASIIATLCTIIQMLLILILSESLLNTQALLTHIAIPMILTAAVGCYAFQQVLLGLDKIRLTLENRETKIRAQRAEIRALNAQIEPHFLMNVLNAIKALIRIDPSKARFYLSKLGEFLHETRYYAHCDTISIKEEILHVQKYLDFQALRFSTAINFSVQNETESLLDFKIPPRSLITLIENTLVHGFNPDSKTMSITVLIIQQQKNLVISVSDNGDGIIHQESQLIGHEPSPSNHKDGGNGLYHLRKTLQKIYGHSSHLDINNLPNKQGTIVRLFIPINFNKIDQEQGYL